MFDAPPLGGVSFSYVAAATGSCCSLSQVVVNDGLMPLGFPSTVGAGIDPLRRCDVECCVAPAVFSTRVRLWGMSEHALNEHPINACHGDASADAASAVVGTTSGRSEEVDLRCGRIGVPSEQPCSSLRRTPAIFPANKGRRPVLRKA